MLRLIYMLINFSLGVAFVMMGIMVVSFIVVSILYAVGILKERSKDE